jgi:hypothetical protein
MLGPPQHVKPPVLFRLLLRRPRPWIAIDYRVPGAEGVPLCVRALRAAELAECFDTAGECASEARTGRVSCELIARALTLPGGALAFRSAEHAADALDARTADVLAGEVSRALDIVSPFYSMIDHVLWKRALVQGARHPHNGHDALTLGSCVSFAFGYGVSRVTYHPER